MVSITNYLQLHPIQMETMLISRLFSNFIRPTEQFRYDFEYEHIFNSEWDEFEQDIGYYNPGSNGMFWVEAYLWSDEIYVIRLSLATYGLNILIR